MSFLVAELGPKPPVFDVIGRPTARGVTWAWAREDLDRASIDRARAQLAELYTDGRGPRQLLVYLGHDCFVDLGGLRLLLDLVGQARQHHGALAVVAPPPGLTRMLSRLELDEQLPVIDSAAHAASRRWTRTHMRIRPRSARPMTCPDPTPRPPR
jgi:anti-anti-sigma regulatory factor